MAKGPCGPEHVFVTSLTQLLAILVQNMRANSTLSGQTVSVKDITTLTL